MTMAGDNGASAHALRSTPNLARTLSLFETHANETGHGRFKPDGDDA